MITIAVQVDGGAIQRFVIDGNESRVDQPFAPGQVVDLKRVFPTRPSAKEFSENPSLEDGTSGDLTLTSLPMSWYDHAKDTIYEIGTFRTWCDYYKARPFEALAWWEHNYGVPITLKKLGSNQRARLGLAV